MSSHLKGTPRIAELDGVRGIAITSVIVQHAFGTPLLWAGVDLFFVLSGFLITGILIRRKELGGSYFGYFYERRARRILVPYVLLLTVSSLLFGTKWLKYWYWSAFFAANVGGALHQVGHESLAALWSLAVEEQFYLVWPWIVIAFPRKKLLGASFVMLITAPILRGIATPWFDSHFPIYYLTPFRMDLLASGAILAWSWRWNSALLNRLGSWPQVVLVCAVGLLVSLGLIDSGFQTGANTIRGNVFIYTLTNIIASCFVMTALLGHGAVCRFLRNPVLRYIGTISYSMYLIHQSALILARQMFSEKIAAFGMAFALTIVYATACWFGFEKRLLSGGRTSPDEKTAAIRA